MSGVCCCVYLQRTLEAIQRGDEDPRMHALANPTDRLSSKKLRADITVRPLR